jgi:hypothetical protein
MTNLNRSISGHLARHNRIHTGEKNFPCLFPGCQSRFSRQDNMMQHYRTHMSPKSRRSQKRGAADEVRPRPRLHAHHRIKSDPVRVEPPLTIDQHLSNYHQSLRASPLSQSTTIDGITTTAQRHLPVRFNFPLPLSSAARSPSSLKKVVGNSPSPIIPISSIQSQHQQEISTPSPTLSHSSSTTSLPSIHHIIDDAPTTSTPTSRPTSPVDNISYKNNNNSNNNLTIERERERGEAMNISAAPPPQPLPQPLSQPTSSPNLSPSNSTSTLFYQHRPLTFSRPQNSSFPFTLLHPTQHQEEDGNVTPNQGSGKEDDDPAEEKEKDDPMDEDDNDKSPSSGGLLQLAHIVSTFG